MALRVGEGEGSRLPDDGDGKVGPGDPMDLSGNGNRAAPGGVEQSRPGGHSDGPGRGDGGECGPLPEMVRSEKVYGQAVTDEPVTNAIRVDPFELQPHVRQRGGELGRSPRSNPDVDQSVGVVRLP